MFGKVMASRDELIEKYFIHATRLDLEKVAEIMKKDPRDAKLDLAFEITKIYHGEEEAQKARENWITQFSKKKIPDNLEEAEISTDENILEILKKVGFVSSNKEARRKIDEGAVRILDLDGEELEKISSIDDKISVGEKVLKLGKKMVKILVK